jgi:hypothetical protein
MHSNVAPSDLDELSMQNSSNPPKGGAKNRFQSPLVVFSDLPKETQGDIIDLIVAQIDKHGSNLETAAKLARDALSKIHGMTWQVIIGRGFAFDITALQKNMLHFYYQGELGVLAYKT